MPLSDDEIGDEVYKPELEGAAVVIDWYSFMKWAYDKGCEDCAKACEGPDAPGIISSKWFSDICRSLKEGE